MKRLLLSFAMPFLLIACTHSNPTVSAPMKIDSSRLEAYHWELLEARNQQGQYLDALFVRQDKPVQLDFQQNRFTLSNTCNRLGGSYTLENGRITFSQMISTMMACPDDRMTRLDHEISSRLTGTSSIALGSGAEPLLTLMTASGDALTFIGRPTAENRYGSPGSTMFLEVAHLKRPCPHPLIPNMQCLQVREVLYDQDGRKRVPSPQWQNFYQDIEGYQHQDGIRNVLRVKRYKIANPPADAPDSAYVLDMVVESEIIDR